MIGERIRKIRERKGLTRQELAQRVGISTTALYYIEKGITMPSSSVLMRIAEELGVSADFLLGLSENQSGWKTLPVYNGAKAGNDGSYPDGSTPIDFIKVPPDVNGEFGVKVYGDSMAPEIVEGDVVIVNRNLEVMNNDRVVAIIDDPAPSAVVKIYRESNGMKYLASINPEYPPIIIDNSVKFIAKIVAVIRKYR